MTTTIINVQNITKAIDILRTDVSDITYQYLIENYVTYRDTVLKEHLINVFDFDDEFAEEIIHDEVSALIALCNENEAGYVRFTEI
jgi:hypothetical protein